MPTKGGRQQRRSPAKRVQSASTKPSRPWSPDRGPLLTPAEAADYLGVTERLIRRLLEAGTLPKRKIGRKLIRIHIDDLDALVANSEYKVGRGG
jgi:excisionase family DNA binding protein